MRFDRVRAMMMGVKCAVPPVGPMGRPCAPRCCSACLSTAVVPATPSQVDMPLATRETRLSPEDSNNLERSKPIKSEDWEMSQARIASPKFVNSKPLYDYRIWSDIVGNDDIRQSTVIETANHIQRRIVNGRKSLVWQKPSTSERRHPVFRSWKSSGFRGAFEQDVQKLRDGAEFEKYDGVFLPRSRKFSYAIEKLEPAPRSFDRISDGLFQDEISRDSKFESVPSGLSLKNSDASESAHTRIPCRQGVPSATLDSSQLIEESQSKDHQWDFLTKTVTEKSKNDVFSLVDTEKDLKLSHLPRYAPRLKSTRSSSYMLSQLQRKREAYARRRLLLNEENYFKVSEQETNFSNSVHQHQQPEISRVHPYAATVSQNSPWNSESTSCSGLNAWVEETEKYRTKSKTEHNVMITTPDQDGLTSPSAYRQSQRLTEALPGPVTRRRGDLLSPKSVFPAENKNIAGESNLAYKTPSIKARIVDQINSLVPIADIFDEAASPAALQVKAIVGPIESQMEGKTTVKYDSRHRPNYKPDWTLISTSLTEEQLSGRPATHEIVNFPQYKNTNPMASATENCQQTCNSWNEKALNIHVPVADAMVEVDHETDAGVAENLEGTVGADVMVIDNLPAAEVVVKKLMGEYRHLVHACDTEVAGIDVKVESPVDHGYMTCFSIYCGPSTDFGDGKSRLWVDVLDTPRDVLGAFKAYFEDPTIKKVWHNFSFDRHIFSNHGIKVGGFYADTMHLARLWDSARKGAQGGYSLEALTSDPKVVDIDGGGSGKGRDIKKTSMKDLFGRSVIKRDGTNGKLKFVPPVEELQRSEEDRPKWIQYSAGDAVSTWHLWQSLQKKLKTIEWKIEECSKGNMYAFYQEYWQPFGELLVQMESEGMLVDRDHLADIEKIALAQQKVAVARFQKWACKYCPDAVHMNVSSDSQIRQLLFGGISNRTDPDHSLPTERVFQVPNTDKYIEEGKKNPKKCRPIILCGIGVPLPIDSYTSAGWPAVNGEYLKSLAGKVAIDYNLFEDENDESLMLESPEVSAASSTECNKGKEEATQIEDTSIYGKAYNAFGQGEEGKEACVALAALCEVASINTLISNFIQPLQSGQIIGLDGRVHCSLNINTETGRLSARRPSLQNQPALEKDRYKIRQAFVASEGKSLIVADYGQLELRILAHLANCKSMLDAFEAGGDFHSRTAMNMYSHVREALEDGSVILEWDPKPGEDKPPVPLLKDVFGAERRKAKMLNFSIAYGKTARGLSKDWKVSLPDAEKTLQLWYNDRMEVKLWQERSIAEAHATKRVRTLLGRTRHLPNITSSNVLEKGHSERAAINTPVQGSAADVAMCAMLEINRNETLRELGWKLVLQVHDEVILEGPTESAEVAKQLVVNSMSYPFAGENWLRVKLDVDCKHAGNWYMAK